MPSLDLDRLISALNDARGAFPPETEMRRMENLQMLRVWDGLHQLEAAARSARQRRMTNVLPVTVTVPFAARRAADD